MSTTPLITSPDPSHQAFPKLTLAQLEKIKPFAKLRQVTVGEILFEPGDSGIPVFVVLSGAMNILQPVLSGYQLVVVHKAGGFSGEYMMISGQHAMVRGQVGESGEFLEIPIDNFRSMIARDAELSEMFMRVFILRRLELIAHEVSNTVLLGSEHSPATLRLRDFLSRNGQPYRYVDLDTDQQSQYMLDRFHVNVDDVPVVICNGRHVLRNPSTAQLADCLGLNANIDASQVRDLIVVGAGPSGLAAAVYAASEGLDVLVVEAAAPGGQAGSSSRIENYLGFPTGISGAELTGRALAQAQKFGANMMVARRVVRLHCDRRPYQIALDQGAPLSTRAIVLAAGAQYNKPPIKNLEKFEGVGVYYGATAMESQFCVDQTVVVIGGGNSAGQAAIFLSEKASKLYMLVRSTQLSDTMSRYLIRRIEENPRIEMHYETEILSVDGSDHMESVTWQNKQTGEISTHNVRHLFVMTGASPRTEWLRGCVALDKKGFVVTGHDLDRATLRDMHWPLSRSPQLLETSLPGVFAVGDIRAGNVKRVASAVGEGSIAIHLVHQALAQL